MIEVLRILAPPLVWLGSFSAIYSLHGLGCALGWPEVELALLSLFRGILLAGWLAAFLAQVVLLLALRSERFGSHSPFVRWTSIGTAWVGLVAALWTLHPVATISPCGSSG